MKFWIPYVIICIMIGGLVGTLVNMSQITMKTRLISRELDALNEQVEELNKRLIKIFREPDGYDI